MSAGDSLPVLSMDAAFDAPADVVPPQQVEWRGVDWHQVLAFALMWEVVYHAGKYACSRTIWYPSTLNPSLGSSDGSSVPYVECDSDVDSDACRPPNDALTQLGRT